MYIIFKSNNYYCYRYGGGPFFEKTFWLDMPWGATWRLLPDQGVDVGNAMGYSVMLRNSGTGLGNFVSGAVLNMFPVVAYVGAQEVEMAGVPADSLVEYSLVGYAVVCTTCTLSILFGAWAVYCIPALIQQELKEVPRQS